MLYQNPIIRGFNPDPSICRVEDDFYLVTSSFEFFPGLPIYHSKNLVNWTLISHGLMKNEDLPLEGGHPSGGLYAPTLRYHRGVYFIICTNVTAMGNFIIHTCDIQGEWSKPAVVDHEGIDPSLFFDDDGKCYFCGTKYESGGGVIELAQIDPLSGKLLAPKVKIYGCGGKSPEAPHIYKHNGYYYLMLAEGGTEYGHMVTIQRSRNIFNGYEPCPHNPVLSHKDKHGILQAIGHADITEDANGNLWATCLGIRSNAFLHHLGRETFLAKARWTEDDWLEIGEKGTLGEEMDAPLPGTPQPVSFAFHDDFKMDKLNPHWTFLRNPVREDYCLKDGQLVLRGSMKDLDAHNTSPTFIGIRQPETNICAETRFHAELSDGGKAGITAFYSQDYYYALYLTKRRGRYSVCLNKAVHDINVVTNSAELEIHGDISFRVTADKEMYYFFYKTGSEWILLGTALTAGLATEGTYRMTFTGTFIGLYAVNGTASFDAFDLNIVE